ncbi:MAG: hypothetical protein AAB221_02510 [Bacteroidota bacterium]
MASNNLLTRLRNFRALFLSSLLFCSHFAFSQGAWDIDYLPIDSVSSKDIGKEFRLDLKTNNPIKQFNSIRARLSMFDTGFIYINDTSVELRENWKIYVDHGVCSEQFLVSVKEISPGIKLYLGNSVIKDITIDSIFLLSDLEFRKKELVIEKRTEAIGIKKNSLSGLLYRRE